MPQIKTPPVAARGVLEVLFQGIRTWWFYYTKNALIVNSFLKNKLRLQGSRSHALGQAATRPSGAFRLILQSSSRRELFAVRVRVALSCVVCSWYRLLQSGSTAVPYPCEHITSADRTGILPAERWRGHLPAETDSGRAGRFYQIWESLSSALNGTILTCCSIIRQQYFRECSISFCPTSYKRCDRNLNWVSNIS